MPDLEAGDIVKVKYVRQWVKLIAKHGDQWDTWSQTHGGTWHDRRYFHEDELTSRKRKQR
ncbi:hypothetical protein [Porticoccus sp.]